MTLVIDRGNGYGRVLAYCEPDISGRSQYVRDLAEARQWAHSIGLKPTQWRYADDRLATSFVAD